MQLTSRDSLRVNAKQTQTKLSPTQKKFNTLLKKLEKERISLNAWQETLLELRSRYHEQYLPLHQALDEHRVAMLRFLDKAADRCRLTRRERENLHEIIRSIMQDFSTEAPRLQVQELFEKYFSEDYATLKAREKEVHFAKARELFGIDLNEDTNFDSPEELLAQLFEKLGEQFETEKNAPKPRKKSAAALAKELKQQEEEKKTSQSLKDIFRQLTKVLHPDREPDAAERDRKNALMQRANNAYQKQDLLTLLELQLEVEQVDLNHIGTLAEEQLKRYNRVLTDQLRQLEMETGVVQASIASQCPLLSSFSFLTPQATMKSFQQDVRFIQELTETIKADLELFKNNEQALREWIREYQ